MDAEGWDRRYAAEERVFASGPHPLVVEAVEPLAAGRALDLAAGEGRHALWLAHRGWQVTAVDFSRVGLEKGRRWADDQGLAVDWVLADVYRYEPPTGAFDLVLIVQFHPAPPHRARVFADAARALRPGGRLLAVGRHVDDIGRDGGRGPSSPDLRYTPEGLRESLPDTLEVLRCEAVRREVEDTVLTDVVAVGQARSL